MTQHERDLKVPCPTCLADAGENCRGIFHDDGTPAPEFVCFRRRVCSLLRERELRDLN